MSPIVFFAIVSLIVVISLSVAIAVSILNKSGQESEKHKVTKSSKPSKKNTYKPPEGFKDMYVVQYWKLGDTTKQRESTNCIHRARAKVKEEYAKGNLVQVVIYKPKQDMDLGFIYR